MQPVHPPSMRQLKPFIELPSSGLECNLIIAEGACGTHHPPRLMGDGACRPRSRDLFGAIVRSHRVIMMVGRDTSRKER